MLRNPSSSVKGSYKSLRTLHEVCSSVGHSQPVCRPASPIQKDALPRMHHKLHIGLSVIERVVAGRRKGFGGGKRGGGVRTQFICLQACVRESGVVLAWVHHSHSSMAGTGQGREGGRRRNGRGVRGAGVNVCRSVDLGDPSGCVGMGSCRHGGRERRGAGPQARLGGPGICAGVGVLRRSSKWGGVGVGTGWGGGIHLSAGQSG